MQLTLLRKLTFFFCALFLTSVLAFGQTSLSNKGKVFWAAFPSNHCTSGCSGNNIEFNMTGLVATTGTITCPGTALYIPFSVTPGALTTVSVPYSYVIWSSQVAEKKGILIQSLDTINVNAANYKVGTSDGTMLLSLGSLGTDYMVNTYAGTSLSYPSHFVVVASQNNTTVTITPSVTTQSGNGAWSSWNVVLNQGDAYMVRSSGNGDLTGSTVVSSAPVAVFGSSNCTNVPSNITYCDMLYEQMIPNIAWGTEYVSGHLMGRFGGDFFQILSKTANTQVQINGTTVATLGAGQVYSTTINGGNHITANNPIAVAQYSRGRNADGTPNSDPFMIMLIPTDKYGNNYTFGTSSPSVTATNHITVTTKTINTALVRLNGAPMTGPWTPCGASGYSYAVQQIANGAHTLTSDSTLGAVVYGWGASGTSTSYGYYVGTNVPITVLPIDFEEIQGHFNENHNQVNWTVVADANNESMTLERSLNSKDWETVFETDDLNKTEFEYKDYDIRSEAIYFYRVRGLDKNGISSFSNTIAVTTGETGQLLKITPNPVRSTASLDAYLKSAGTVTITLFDVSGRKVAEMNEAAIGGFQSFDLSNMVTNLESGIYMLQVSTADGKLTQKLIKQ